MVEFIWKIKYLRNFMLDKELFKCQVNSNMVIYSAEVRLVCPQRISEDVYREFEKEVLKLKT